MNMEDFCIHPFVVLRLPPKNQILVGMDHVLVGIVGLVAEIKMTSQHKRQGILVEVRSMGVGLLPNHQNIDKDSILQNTLPLKEAITQRLHNDQVHVIVNEIPGMLVEIVEVGLGTVAVERVAPGLLHQKTDLELILLLHHPRVVRNQRRIAYVK